MTDRYASVAEHYDIMIDWPARLARERPCFAGLFAERPIARVLDVGCGTGHHSRLFAELGAEVIGLDPSLPMLLHARALTHGKNPKFVEGGFAQIPQLGGGFDLVVVLGNALAYVEDARQLAWALGSMRQALAPGGRLLVQVVNYDSLHSEQDRWLPVITRTMDDREYLFQREYRLLGKHAEFTLITLIRDGQWRQTVERSTHYPITGERLQRALARAGFNRFDLYGGFGGDPYAPSTSPNLLALAEAG